MLSSLVLRKTLTAVTLAVLAAVGAACGDEVTDPEAFLDSAEAEAILRSAAALPALPAVIDRGGDPPDQAGRIALYRAQELWAAGLSGYDERARTRRRLAVRYAAPALVDQLAVADWDDVEAGLRAWLGTAGSLLEHISLPRVRGSVDAARLHLDRAALASDERARAQALLLAGADLVETTPRFLARALSDEAETAVARAVRLTRDPEDADLRRAVRLKDWAARAVESGEYLVAIQRAYYALQLVEAR